MFGFQVKEEHIVMLVFAVVLFLVTVFFSQFTKTPESEPQKNTATAVDPCAVPVAASCEVQIEKEYGDCDNEQRFSDNLSSLLAEPEQSDACQEKRLSLEQSCPTDCLIDFSSLYSLAGALEVQVLAKTEKGCLVRGSRVVKMRANCISGQTAKPQTTTTP